MRSGIHRSLHLSPARPRFGGLTGLLIVILLVVVATIIWGIRGQQENVRRERPRFETQQRDPEEMLTRFFLERSQSQPFEDGAWESLLELMSTEDRLWLQENLVALSDHFSSSEGVVPTDEYRLFVAVQGLLELNRTRERPVIVRIALDPTETCGVGYWHPPGRVADLREVFIVRETENWRIRRFLNNRDTMGVMQAVVAAKEAAGKDLTEEEQLFRQRPEEFRSLMRSRLLAEVGLNQPQMHD